MKCECGCGKETRLYRGKPNRFIWGHSNMLKKGDKNLNWKGCKALYKKKSGKIKKMSHIIAEKSLGRKLKSSKPLYGNSEIVHHINQNNTDNRRENLLICTSSYHVYLHNRMRRVGYNKLNPIKT